MQKHTSNCSRNFFAFLNLSELALHMYKFCLILTNNLTATVEHSENQIITQSGMFENEIGPGEINPVLTMIIMILP